MTDQNVQTAWDLEPEKFKAIMTAVLEGARPADAAGVSQKQLEALYALGHSLYMAGSYHDAATIFQGLCLYDYGDCRFWTGLGASLQGEGQYEKAIDVYSMAAMTTGLADPGPIYYAAQCYMKLNRVEEAIAALEGLSVMGAEGRADHAVIKAQGAGLLEVLKSGLAERKS
jgi:type III secretion system low calcium response chaperone LcrH/SycD